MDFFERLRERTIHKLLIQEGYDPVEDADVFEPHPDGWKGDVEDVDATIEALKEMMVGKPERGSLEHGSYYTWVKEINDKKEGVFRARVEGIHGTDGEEVVVMVLRW